MKLVALSFFLALSAHAMPNVGDSAYLEGTLGGQPIQERFTLTAFNPSTNQFKRETVFVYANGSPQASEEWVNASDLPTDTQMQMLLANCAANHGTSETVAVPAGVMATCKLPLERGGTANLAPVPFGIAKIDSVVNDQPLSMALVSFARGGQ